MMILPPKSGDFKDFVISKIKMLCDSNAWPFEFDRFGAWLDNFDNELDEYCALQILNSLIVRTNEMARSTYFKLLASDVHQFIVKNIDGVPCEIDAWLESLSSGSLREKIRFSPVRLADDEGESGSVIYRLLSCWVDTDKYSLLKAKSNPEVVILVDDFLGSGTQFLDFAREISLDQKLVSSKFIYCPLVAMHGGIDFVKAHYPSVEIFPGEVVQASHSLFFGDGFFLYDEINEINVIKNYYMEMKDRVAPKMPFWLGRDNSAIPLVFEWGCPNQAPSILYMKYSKIIKPWSQLFGRRS